MHAADPHFAGARRPYVPARANPALRDIAIPRLHRRTKRRSRMPGRMDAPATSLVGTDPDARICTQVRLSLDTLSVPDEETNLFNRPRPEPNGLQRGRPPAVTPRTRPCLVRPGLGGDPLPIEERSVWPQYLSLIPYDCLQDPVPSRFLHPSVPMEKGPPHAVMHPGRSGPAPCPAPECRLRLPDSGSTSKNLTRNAEIWRNRGNIFRSRSGGAPRNG